MCTCARFCSVSSELTMSQVCCARQHGVQGACEHGREVALLPWLCIVARQESEHAHAATSHIMVHTLVSLENTGKHLGFVIEINYGDWLLAGRLLLQC